MKKKRLFPKRAGCSASSGLAVNIDCSSPRFRGNFVARGRPHAQGSHFRAAKYMLLFVMKPSTGNMEISQVPT